MSDVIGYRANERRAITIPEAQEPDHVPPVNEIQFLWPNGVGPTDTRGWRATDIRKSRLRLQPLL